jgi:hypothetical protein
MSVEREMVDAYRAGEVAARSGQLVATNPFDAEATTARDRVQALMWMRGYGAGNPVEDDAGETSSSAE